MQQVMVRLSDPAGTVPWWPGCFRCDGLKGDPQPGLFSWVGMVGRHFRDDHDTDLVQSALDAGEDDYKTAPWRVGDVVHGFCGGYFGRDFSGPAKVEAIGSDWVLFRTNSGGVATISGGDVEDVKEYRDPKWDY